MKKLLLLTVVAAVTGCHEGRNDRTDQTTSNGSGSTRTTTDTTMRLSADARILSILNAIDRDEIEMGRLAQTRGASDGVVQYGRMLERDHNDHVKKVESAARNAGIQLMDPAQVKVMLNREKGKTGDPGAELRSLNGDAFDRRFAEVMHQGHTDAISKVTEAQPQVGNAQVKDLLAQTLPTLREHDRMATELMKR